MIKRFKKKPVVIEAVQYTGNFDEIMGFCGQNQVNVIDENLYINTLEGDMKAEYLDWIIKGVNGEFYPCKPDIFQKTYEKAE